MAAPRGGGSTVVGLARDPAHDLCVHRRMGLPVPADGREYEFAFPRRHGCRIVCIFTGSEIRSHVLMAEVGSRLQRDVITTYQPLSAPTLATPARERERRRLAEATDRHAEVIFNPPVDQSAYLTRSTEPFPYFVEDVVIRRRPEKWVAPPDPLVLLHAPTAPLIKGTPLVRAAVSRLRSEGYVFEYVELQGRSNTQVQRELRRAHVVLNEFYSFVPGVFGLEAMAANAVMLCSADPKLEPSLPPDAADAWVVTPAWDIADRLRDLMNHPDRMQLQADRGTEWVLNNAAWSVSAARLRTTLEC